MSNDLSRQAIVRKAILGILSATDKDLSRKIAASLENGQTLRIADEFGDPLGTIVKTQAPREPVIEDPAAAFGYVSGLNPDYVDYLLPDAKKNPERYFDAVDVLVEAGRYDLLSPTLNADTAKVVLDKVKDHYRETGELPAGWVIPEAREGTLRITPSKEAKAQAAALLRTNDTLQALTAPPVSTPADVLDADN